MKGIIIGASIGIIINIIALFLYVLSHNVSGVIVSIAVILLVVAAVIHTYKTGCACE